MEVDGNSESGDRIILNHSPEAMTQLGEVINLVHQLLLIRRRRMQIAVLFAAAAATAAATAAVDWVRDRVVCRRRVRRGRPARRLSVFG